MLNVAWGSAVLLPVSPFVFSSFPDFFQIHSFLGPYCPKIYAVVVDMTTGQIAAALQRTSKTKTPPKPNRAGAHRGEEEAPRDTKCVSPTDTAAHYPLRAGFVRSQRTCM